MLPVPSIESVTSSGAATAYLCRDVRLTLLDRHIKRHFHQSDALIEVLHCAQDLFGALSKELLLYISVRLNLPPSRVYGVASFYPAFRLEPVGRHACAVCNGTS